METQRGIALHKRISSILLALFTGIGIVVLLGLVTLSLRMTEILGELRVLRDEGLPQLVKLSQLSQEAAASISIAPALSANPSRYEFETLLSRIQDKETSQRIIIEELAGLVSDEQVASTLQRNGELLSSNLRSLVDIVSEQVAVRGEIEARIETVTSGWKGTDRKNMFGGVCHLLNGNMFCGVYKDFLILRLGEENATKATASPFVRPFDITGRPMKGWVMVEQEGFSTDADLENWLNQAREFVRILPAK